MVRVKFLDKLISSIFVLLFISCESNSEKALSDAVFCFDTRVMELKLDSIKFVGPEKLTLFEKKYPPKKGHIIYGWKSKPKDKEIWVYVDIDTTFNKEPSLSYSTNFFEEIEK